jgi:Ca2+-transporting ATPase
MLLKALQRNGHVVCMTGDGVNDAAAIKNSDVGIAMGIRGTEVTKQASDMVVLDDDFVTIRNAVAQGRGTFDNIRKFVAYLLGANISEVLIIFLVSLLSLGLSSKIAIQLLWINLVTDGLPALALGVDPPSKDIMQRRPRKKGEPVLDRSTMYFILSIGLSATAAILGLYACMLSLGDAVKAQTALFTAFVVMEMLIVYVVRLRYDAGASRNTWLHIAVASSLLLQAALLYTPLAAFFGIVPLGLGDVAGIAVSLAGFLVLLSVFMKLEPVFAGRSGNTGLKPRTSGISNI